MCTSSVRISPSISSPCFLSVATVGPGVRSPLVYEFSNRHPFRGKPEILDPIFPVGTPTAFTWLGPRLDERRHDTIHRVLGGIDRISIIMPMPTHSPCPSLSRTFIPRNGTPCMDPVNVASPPRSSKPDCCHSRLTTLQTAYTGTAAQEAGPRREATPLWAVLLKPSEKVS